jgi:hypothetical protein
MQRPRWCLAAVLSSAILLASSAPARADVTTFTDVGQSISQLLNSFGPVPKTVTASQTISGQRCQPIHNREGSGIFCTPFSETQTTSSTVNAILGFSNARIVAQQPITTGPVVITDLSPIFDATAQENTNCAPVAATATVSLATQISRTAVMQVSHSITNTLGANLGFNIAIEQGVNLTGQISVSSAATTGTLQSNQLLTSTTHTSTQTVPMQPQTTTIAKIAVFPVQYSTTFRTTVTVDADLSDNNNGFHRLSDIFDESKRTFVIDGTITANDATFAAVVLIPAAFDTALCASASATARGGVLQPPPSISPPQLAAQFRSLVRDFHAPRAAP